jgi:hypothetical protein
MVTTIIRRTFTLVMQNIDVFSEFKLGLYMPAACLLNN